MGERMAGPYQDEGREPMSTETTQRQVFLCHAPEDQSVARQVAETLEARGVRCWPRQPELYSISDSLSLLLRGIRQCPVFVLLDSVHSHTSVLVRRQCLVAIESQARILVLALTDRPTWKEIAILQGSEDWVTATRPPLASHVEMLAQRVEAILATTGLIQMTRVAAQASSSSTELGTDESEKSSSEDFLSVVAGLRPGADMELLSRVHEFCTDAHRGQYRMSGEPYMTHCEATAQILAELGFDTDTMACGLLHDILEDSHVSIAELEGAFGPEIASICNGVWKSCVLRIPDSEQGISLFRALITDVRVVLVRLADRLHNMRTLLYLPGSHHRRIAAQTRDFFAPLADRLGMSRVRRELEDLAMTSLEPEAYRTLVEHLVQTRGDRELLVERLASQLAKALEEEGIAADVHGVPKTLYSIHQARHGRCGASEGMCDLLTMRVVANSVPECYRSLEILHRVYQPIPERFDDFIKEPKHNLYRALHTVVVGPHGELPEVRIGTRETWETAEHGIGAYWWRADNGLTEAAKQERRLWLKRALDWFQGSLDLVPFIYFVEVGCSAGEISVFTSAGVRTILPRGSTPIDLAYARDSLTGNHCGGALIGGAVVPLDYELQNGDIADVVIVEDARPQRGWLTLVKTKEARSGVLEWLLDKDPEAGAAARNDLLQSELARMGVTSPSDEDLVRAANALGFELSPRAIGLELMGPEVAAVESRLAGKSSCSDDSGGGHASVFLSAKGEDYEYAHPVYEFLMKRGVSTFFSMESLPQLGNADYRKEIDRALEHAKHMVLVTSSKENATAPWVEAEWGVFINEKRGGRKPGNLITLLAGDMSIEDLPPSLRYYQVIPFGRDSLEKMIPYLK